MSKTLADTTLGLGAQARAVLALLAATEPHNVAPWNDERREYDVEINTRAWYNGRERGVLLEVRPNFASTLGLIITFGEHRNSDDIFVDAWIVNEVFLNPPTVADFPEEAYKRRQCFREGRVGEVVDFIRLVIKTFLEKASLPETVRPALSQAETPRLGRGRTPRSLPR